MLAPMEMVASLSTRPLITSAATKVRLPSAAPVNSPTSLCASLTPCRWPVKNCTLKLQPTARIKNPHPTQTPMYIAKWSVRIGLAIFWC